MTDGQKRVRRSERTADMTERADNRQQEIRMDASSIRGYIPQRQDNPAQAAEAGQPEHAAYGNAEPQGQMTQEQYEQYLLGQQYARQMYEQQIAQRAAAQQQYAMQQYAEQQSSERKRISEQTAFNGGLRGYANPAEKKPEKGKKAGKHRAVKITAIVLAVSVLITGGAYAARSYFRTKQINDAVTPYDNLFCPGVYVDGIALGGMTKEQASNSIMSRIQERINTWKVQLIYEGNVLGEINADMLGTTVDITPVLDEAFQQGHTGENEQRYEAMKALAAQPYEAYTAAPSGDTSRIDSLLADLKEKIDTPAQNARMYQFDPAQPQNPFLYEDEKNGRVLNTETIRETLYKMAAAMQGGTVTLVPDQIAPNVTKMDLKSSYMLRSSEYTRIATSSEEDRNRNIAKALEKINGTVLRPGEKFSFNGIVGERTEKNGFLPAIEYAYGEHVMGIGGGVCQASTTVYQAAVCAGLEILERTPHSDKVNYTDYGKDATVYWNDRKKIDLVFRNNTSKDLFIVCAVEQDPGNNQRKIARVSIWGEDMGDVRYAIDNSEQEVLPAPTEPERIADKKGEYVTYIGQEKTVSQAQDGCKVWTYRTKYVQNEMVERIPLNRGNPDVYEARPTRIYYGISSRENK